MKEQDKMNEFVTASVENIGIDQEVFGEKSKAKLVKILNQNGIKELFEEIPQNVENSLKEADEETKQKFTKENVRNILMTNVVLRILKEVTVKQLVKGYVTDEDIEDVTDEDIEMVIERRIVWSAIVEKEGQLKKEIRNWQKHE